MIEAQDQRALIIPALGRIYDALSPWAYSLVRVAAGAILMVHGYVKLFLGGAAFIADKMLPNLGFYPPIFWAYFLGILELAGGALIVIGLLTRPIALMLVIEFLIITFGWNSRFGFGFTNPGGVTNFRCSGSSCSSESPSAAAAVTRWTAGSVRSSSSPSRP